MTLLKYIDDKDVFLHQKGRQASYIGFGGERREHDLQTEGDLRI